MPPSGPTAAHIATDVNVGFKCSYKGVKGRSRTVEKRLSMHPHKPHATSQGLNVNVSNVQAQTGDLERRIAANQDQLATARHKKAELQQPRVSLSTRIADATAALAALSAAPPAVPPPPHAPPSSSGLDPSATAAAARACLGHRDTSTTSSHATTATSTAHSHHSACPPASTHPDTLNAALIPHPTRQHVGTFYTPPGQNARAEAPRPIASFRHRAGISYEDLCAVAGGSSDLLDFSQHSVLSLIEESCRRKVGKLGSSDTGPGMTGDDVCWFPEMQYDAADGVSLSSSATISSPECFASLAIQGALTQLELALVTAATDHSSTSTPGGISCGHASKAPPPRKAPRCPVSGRAHTAATVPTLLPASRAPTEHRPASVAAGRSSGAAGGVGDGDALAADGGTSRARGDPPRWSGRVRCGVNETHDGRAAVRWIVRSLMRQFAAVVPRHTILELLDWYGMGLLRIIASAGQHVAAAGNGGDGETADSRRSGGGGSMVAFITSATAAAHGVMQVLSEEIADVADTRVLQRLVRCVGRVHARRSAVDLVQLHAVTVIVWQPTLTAYRTRCRQKSRHVHTAAVCDAIGGPSRAYRTLCHLRTSPSSADRTSTNASQRRPIMSNRHVQAAEAGHDHAQPDEPAALERQAHTALVANAVINAFTVRRAPRVHRIMAQHGVFPLTRNHEVCLSRAAALALQPCRSG